MKDWVQFIICFLLSAGAWFMYTMSKDYSDIVYVPVVAGSEIEGRALQSSSESILAARVKTSGFRLARLLSGKKIVKVAFNAEDMEYLGGDVFRVNSSSLTKYIPAIFGDGVVLESFATDELNFRFQERTFRKVPVLPVASVSYRPQYTSAQGVTTIPDSIAVYGEPAILSDIHHVLTKPVNLRDLERNVHGTIALEVPAGVSIINETVEYSINVVRYVEISRKLKIRVRNVPAEVHFSVLPSTANAVFQCEFPIGGTSLDNVSLYVDYRDFQTSISGHCLINVEGLPSEVLHYSIDPEVCDCFEER